MTDQAFRDYFGDFLVEEGRKNKKIVVLDADLSSSTRTYKFSNMFPERFFNLGIAEQNLVGTAIGFAISGKIPIVSGFSIFTTGRAWEFIRLACQDNLNIKFITTHGGLVGEDGSSHHALEDLTLMATLPNMQIFIPADVIELDQILKYVLSIPGPCYVRLPRGSFPKIHDSDYVFSIEGPDVLLDGEKICLIGTGYGTSLAYNSAGVIEKKLGFRPKVINLPSIKPINDKNLIEELQEIQGIVLIEEHNTYSGFGSIISRIVSQYMAIRMSFIGINDKFVLSGRRNELLEKCGLNVENVVEVVRRLCESILI